MPTSSKDVRTRNVWVTDNRKRVNVTLTLSLVIVRLASRQLSGFVIGGTLKRCCQMTTFSASGGEILSKGNFCFSETGRIVHGHHRKLDRYYRQVMMKYTEGVRHLIGCLNDRSDVVLMLQPLDS